jgi:glucuronate isomerase
MKRFLDKNFLLDNDTAARLYHEYASRMPIIDYHCHLNPQQIADDVRFENLTQLWLAGDHYKWRAMRASGVDERYCTGDASDREKFMKWAGTVPDTLRNPLYHWTHLELQRYFGIDDLLGIGLRPGFRDADLRCFQR